MNESITVPFRLPTTSPDPALVMEQAPWDGTVGIVTKLDLVKALDNALYGGDDENDIDCGMDGDCYLSGLFVYPFDPELLYDVDITHGDLGEAITQYIEVRELVKFKLGTETELKYPMHELISKEWGAETWDSKGNITSDPSISITGRVVTISKKVWGTVIVAYATIRHARQLLIPPREDAVENVFDSYAWARWDGGVKLLKLKPPENAEEAYFNESNCIWGSRLGGVTPGEPGDPDVTGSGEETFIDYCTQMKLVHNV